MRVPILLIGVAIVLCAPPLQAEQSPRATARRHVAVDRDRMAVDGGLRVVFSAREVEMIREHYAPRYANLPPGLQKKLARTGQLPPGWQKKMEAFPVALTRRLPSLPDGYARGVIDGRAVIYVPGTSLIIDVTVLF